MNSQIMHCIETHSGQHKEGHYYQDCDEELNPFIGTWIYNSGNGTTLKIVLRKKEDAFNSSYYEDLLIGEYEYTVNGNVLISTLSTIMITYPNQRNHNIAGNYILDNNSKPPCSDCGANEKRVLLQFYDPVRNVGGELVVRRVSAGGAPAIRIRKRSLRVYGTEDNPPAFTEQIVPSGEYILQKVL